MTTIRNQDHEIEELHKELNKYKNLVPDAEVAKPAKKKAAVKKAADKKTPAKKAAKKAPAKKE